MLAVGGLNVRSRYPAAGDAINETFAKHGWGIFFRYAHHNCHVCALVLRLAIEVADALRQQRPFSDRIREVLLVVHAPHTGRGTSCDGQRCREQ